MTTTTRAIPTYQPVISLLLLFECAFAGASEHPLDQDSGDMPLVLRRPALVGDRLAGRGGERGGVGEELLRGRLADERAFRVRRRDLAPDGGQRDARLGDPAVFERERG